MRRCSDFLQHLGHRPEEFVVGQCGLRIAGDAVLKISHITVKNFRSVESLELPVTDYVALVGANGSGKSSVLYAIDWMLNNRSLHADDAHNISSDREEHAPVTVSVELTFTDFTDADRARLEKYGRGDSLTVRKSWTVGDAKAKLIGRSLQGPNFLSVRSAVGVADARIAYEALREIHEDLPSIERLTKAAELDAYLSAWEDDPEHRSQLKPVDNEDVTNFFGIDGQNRLRQCLRMVLVPAASDIPGEVAGGRKGSAVNDLIGLLMGNAGAEAREAWTQKNAAAIDELAMSMRESVANATEVEAERINKRLQSLVSNSLLTFTPEVPVWVPSPTPSVTTDVSIDGITNDVSRQGHGVQRAVMIAMFESLAPDEDTVERDHVAQEGETEEEAAARLKKVKEQLPALLICIEEPEIYQHPVRARAFARVLADLAAQPRAQVMVATHSPYFVTPSQFESLRRFTLMGGKSVQTNTTVTAVTSSTVGVGKEDQVRKTVTKQIPTTFAEGFFAEAVVLVEGQTDKVVLERLAERLNRPFDAVGISLAEIGGKGSIRIPAGLLTELKIPTYVIADGDALGASRKTYTPPTAQVDVHSNHKAECDRLVAWLPTPSVAYLGTWPYSFDGPSVVTDKCTIWHDDLESELARWPSFVAAQLANGHAARSKNVLEYLADVDEAKLEDLPGSLSTLVDAIHQFRLVG